MELRSLLPILSVIGFYLLWVVMAKNGTINALDLVTKTGAYPNGRPLRTSYVNIPSIDGPISTLIAFTDALTGGNDPATRIVMIDVVSTLQTGALWVIIESIRNGAGSVGIVLSSLWPLLWNGFGAGFILPIYYYLNLKGPHKNKALPLNHARTLMATSVLTLFLPAIIVLPPFPVTRPAEDNQTLAALFQITPFIAAVCQAILGSLTSSKSTSGPYAAKILVRQTYLVSGIFAAAGHIYAGHKTIHSNNPAVSWSRVYVPSPSDVIPNSQWTVLEGALLFIKYDWIIINISSVLWLYLSLKPYLNMRTAFDKGSTLFLIILSTLVVGPGASVSWGLRLRENWIK